MSKADDSASGAVASQRGSANAGSVEVGRDIIGSVVVTGHGNQVTVTIQGENVRDRELVYLDGLLKRYEYWREHYTPLAGITEVRKAVKDGPRLDLPMPFIPPGFEKLVEHGYGERVEVQRVAVDDLQKAVAEHRRIILLGEPGSGKTTTLWRSAYDYAVVAREDGRAPLPVLVPLGGYTDSGLFDDYLGRYLGPLAPYFETYRTSGRLILLLDGLNEMPQADYAERVGRIREVLDRQPDETVVVTCRTLDYVVKLERLQKVEISPLDETRIQTFLHHYLGEVAGERLFWSMAGGDEVLAVWKAWQRAGGTWIEFWTAEKIPEEVYRWTTIAQRRLWHRLRKEPPRLLKLSRNPYVLLMTAQVYAAEGELPANRAHLFTAFVDTLLERERKRRVATRVEADQVQDGLSALAYAMQSERGRGTTVERSWAVKRLCRAVPDRDAERLLYLATSASLLDADEATVCFYHQLLQEYFAALELKRRIPAGEALTRYWPAKHWWQPSGWEETFVLLSSMEPDASALLTSLTLVNPVVAAHCLVEGNAQTSAATRYDVGQALIVRINKAREVATARVQAGDALARVGDPRFQEDAWFLPNDPLLGFVEIPEGAFLMGSDKRYHPDAFDREFPQHSVELPTYYINRYPVTVAQYRAFVQKSRYETQGPWERWSSLDSHPVVGVTWYDALAYCAWLTGQLQASERTPNALAGRLREEGWRVRLPTEAEWEKAARGTDGRIYPWGDEPDPNRANYHNASIGTTSTVGCFPTGASPFDVQDMSGNVWEWCHSIYRPYPYDSEDGREDPKTKKTRVLRGGSFYNSQGEIRCAYRLRFYPFDWYWVNGFRVVLVPSF